MQLKPNEFTEYDLTEQEIIIGQSLSEEAIAILQNDLATLARQRANLVFNPNKVTDSLIADANIKGRMEMINILIDRSKVIRNYQYEMQNGELYSPQQTDLFNS